MRNLEYIFLMAFVTYLVRTIPFILLRRELQNVFLKSFLAYIPYTVLAAMTVPAIFYATESRISGVLSLVAAVCFSLFNKSLVLVAAVTCATVLLLDGFLL